MENNITDEKTGIEYKLIGDYYLPMIKAQETPKIGMWGQKYLRYLKENRKAYYTVLLLSGKLFDRAAEIDYIAEELYDCLTKEIAFREGVTEKLKVNAQIEWVRRMNSIHNRAEEVVLSKIIYQ